MFFEFSCFSWFSWLDKRRRDGHRNVETTDDRRRNDRAVEEAHALRMVGAVEGRSDPGRTCEGDLFLDAGRQALHRLQQPVDVREHRPRRRARDSRDSGAGRGARVRQSVHGHRTARAARRQARRDHAGRHRRLLLHQRRRRGERERDQAGAPLDRTAQDSRALPFVSRRHRGQHHADRRSPALGRGARHPGRRARPRSVSRHRARLGHGGRVADHARGSDPARRAAKRLRRSSSKP